MRAVEVIFEKSALAEYRELEKRANENRNSVEARIFLEAKRNIDALKKALEENRRVEIGKAIPRSKLSSKLIKWLKRYRINIIWSVQLPEAWRMVYAIVGDEIRVIAFILNISDHKSYENFLNQ